MDLVDSSPARISPDNVKPEISVSALPGGYQFEITVLKRHESDMYKVQVRRMNTETWTNAESGTGKTIVVSLQPTVAGQSERLQVRVQLYRKNQPYGEPSDPQYVNINQ